ncbi:uncharacterized protein LOC128963150 [Oppia nitens]|uniref:uncharacterized protein LOC128963150 n=1 Tax=Oppia nitens TaxID=1686743 RepID=UPI0023DCA1A9|nr:uncharacterized protein LOC128963150 [Oppia nitens]
MDYQKNSTDIVFKNPYLIGQIVSHLDIRSLFQMHCVSKESFDASVYEYEKRKDIIHLYLLNYQQIGLNSDTNKLFESFTHYSSTWLNIRPKHVIVLVGGHRNVVDYRYRQNRLQEISKYLPKECEITYLDVGSTVLTSSIRFRSLTNYGDHNNKELFKRTAHPCLTSLMFPEIEGIKVKSYHNIQEVDITDVSAVLYFQSLKVTKRVPKGSSYETQTTDLVNNLKTRLDDNNICFGGGSIFVVKSRTNCPLLLDQIVLTFGGSLVRSGSLIMSMTDKFTYLPQLTQFKQNLSFNCDDWKSSMSIAFIVANSHNFSNEFTIAFQTVFPFVGMIGFQSNEQMFGNSLVASNSISDSMTNNQQSVDPKRKCVIVLINFAFKTFYCK